MFFKHALIMAAGRGNRMRPLSDLIPKALVPFKGNALIDNSIEQLYEVVDKIHITVGYKKVDLATHLLSSSSVDSIINTSGKENVWWIFNSLMRDLDSPVLVLTCDNVTSLDVNFLEKEYKSLNNPACMLVAVKEIKGVEADKVLSSANKVKQISRNLDSKICCSGIQVINPKKCNELMKEKKSFMDFWNELIGLSQLYHSNVYPHRWFSIDSMQQLEQAESNS